MNQYPLWKYLLILAAVLVGFVFALPNLYGEDPAVQISSSRNPQGVPVLTDSVRAALEKGGLSYESIQLEEGNRLLVRFHDTETQLAAVDLIHEGIGGDFTVALNLAPSTPEWLRAFNAQPMYLGLDLRGGVHFLLEVDMKAALQKAYERYVGEIRTLLREKKIRYVQVARQPDGVVIKFRSTGERDQAHDELRDAYADLIYLEEDAGGDFLLKLSLSESARDEVRRFALEQNITTLRNRVNELGVAEPVIQQQGRSRIVVQLPGVQDTARAKEILGATATLEFRMVDETNDPFEAQESGRVPIGSRLYQQRGGGPTLLQNRVMLTGDYITDAASGIDQQSGGPAVFITLDGKGGRLMREGTKNNVGKLMAVVFIENRTETRVVDGKTVRDKKVVEEVINTARIREQLGKRFQITGLDSTTEARNLALLLRAGALAAPIDIIEERTVGPSLGRQNIEQGFQSVVYGFVAVLIFMALYYRVFGLIANLALTMNLVLMVAVLSMLQATLTLPGIAGIVLTIGMAVDANVLIFERIREELRNGNTPQASIQAGYEKALSTIADANITTLIAAVVLFSFGTGPIKGFAVTLSIGIVTSMFTAIMGTRAVVNLSYGGRRLKALPI